MPYHSTNSFVRVLKILDFSDADPLWHWLKPLQKEAVPLPRDILLNHCVAEQNLLRFFGNNISRTIEVIIFIDISFVYFLIVKLFRAFQRIK